MHRLLTRKEFVHHGCVQQFYTIKIKSFKASAYFATIIYILFFCSLDCCKKILNVKIPQMEFLQKAQDFTLHDYGRSPPTVRNLQLLLRAHLVITGGWYKMTVRQHQPLTTSEYARLLCDPEISN